jgi:hypothetical protein
MLLDQLREVILDRLRAIAGKHEHGDRVVLLLLRVAEQGAQTLSFNLLSSNGLFELFDSSDQMTNSRRE